ncbi:MAG: methyltransferase domain-containing protein [Candidatus Aenigmarchaeota archaeon]|nr:methyltransferase domain-containing protein [Candidatus Aenigmarchaeota archaeon]
MINQKEVWETLADSWINLHVKPEEEVVNFSKNINKGPLLDLGCGNCRNSLSFLEKNIDCVGLDFSKGMIREAKKLLKKNNLNESLVIGNLDNLPFKKGSFLLVMCIRTLHHLESRELRMKALEEMKRVGIKILLSVWKIWQTRFIWQLIKSFFSGHFADVYVDWNYHGKIYKRFYHLYTKKELEDVLKNTGLKIEKIWYDNGNIWSSVNV